jgi:hypothetical protein
MSSAIALRAASSLSSTMGKDRLFIWNNHLTTLVEELHQERIATGSDTNNPRVAEVCHHIAELVRERKVTIAVQVGED